MKLKNIVATDFVNYKKPSMYLAFPFCTFKCEKECGIACCQNSPLATSPTLEISIPRILEIYKDNQPITKALLFCGLEPLDSFSDVVELISAFRKEYSDDIVIYTGYNKEEISDKLQILKQFPNIIMKYGRFVPNDESRFDELLGVTLASKNQYAEYLS